MFGGEETVVPLDEVAPDVGGTEIGEAAFPPFEELVVEVVHVPD